LNSGIKSIGIITPYAEQAKLYKVQISSLKKSYPSKKIEAATVHKYQGREMDMIIFDLVDCYGKSLGKLLSGEHGSDAMRLINVATTRARSKFIVIANVSYITKNLYKWKDNILFQWIQYLSKNAFVDYL
jgi:superfamily I DNA and/or RNA helicase